MDSMSKTERAARDLRIVKRIENGEHWTDALPAEGVKVDSYEALDVPRDMWLWEARYASNPVGRNFADMVKTTVNYGK